MFTVQRKYEDGSMTEPHIGNTIFLVTYLAGCQNSIVKPFYVYVKDVETEQEIKLVFE